MTGNTRTVSINVFALATFVFATATVRAQIVRLPDYEPLSTLSPQLDLDALDPLDATAPPAYVCDDAWSWQFLPDGILYKAYLAGEKESRISSTFFKLTDSTWMWDSTLGGRFGLIRYGTQHDFLPQGFQLDIEGATQVRLDPAEERDLRGADFRAGGLIAYGWGRQQFKFGYYHLSSHVGDEFLLKNLGFPRLNYAKDSLLLGYSAYPTDNLRLYAEAAWAFASDVADPWEFQFGLEWAPAHPTGDWGAPFLAVNGHIRQEISFGGHVTAQAGWAWRSDEHGHLLRIGLHYHNGASSQWSFFDEFEHQLGVGIWYDF